MVVTKSLSDQNQESHGEHPNHLGKTSCARIRSSKNINGYSMDECLDKQICQIEELFQTKNALKFEGTWQRQRYVIKNIPIYTA